MSQSVHHANFPDSLLSFFIKVSKAKSNLCVLALCSRAAARMISCSEPDNCDANPQSSQCGGATHSNLGCSYYWYQMLSLLEDTMSQWQFCGGMPDAVFGLKLVQWLLQSVSVHNGPNAWPPRPWEPLISTTSLSILRLFGRSSCLSRFFFFFFAVCS